MFRRISRGGALAAAIFVASVATPVLAAPDDRDAAREALDRLAGPAAK